MTLAAYARAPSLGFVNYDDGVYASANPEVRAGVASAGIRWAFTTTRASNWHPLTWISLMLDSTLAGTSARAYHTTNLVLHTASTLLLFLFFSRATGCPGKSAFVAALFAVHPLHVESVAWIAERKDVLAGLFSVLTMLAWMRYVESPGAARYAIVALCLALGLMAKPMLVTLPLVLLLLDFWPFGRFAVVGDRERAGGGGLIQRRAARIVLEKTPLFALSALSSAMTLFAQRRGGAIESLTTHPMMARLANAAVSSVAYLIGMFRPTGLAVFYPYPSAPQPAWQVAVCTVFLAATSAVAIAGARRRPWFAVGWFWYLATLVPVIGIVQVGMQTRADRYTYVPLVGVFAILAWGTPELLRRLSARIAGDRAVGAGSETGAASGTRVFGEGAAQGAGGSHSGTSPASREGAPAEGSAGERISRADPSAADGVRRRSLAAVASGGRFARADPDAGNPMGTRLLAAGAAAIVVALATGTYVQTGYWRDSLSLWQRALDVTQENSVAHNNLGDALQSLGRLQEAASEYEEALRIDPVYADAHANLGGVRLLEGRLDQAAAHLSRALEIDPRHRGAHGELGVVLARLGRIDEAIVQFRAALDQDPSDEDARRNLEKALALKPRGGS